MEQVTDAALLRDLVKLAGFENDPLSDDNADLETGAPAGVRAAASIKVTTEGKMNYLKSVFGDENVKQRKDGEFFYKLPSGKKWVQFDEDDVTWTDIADMAGGAIEAAPSVVTGFATLNPGAAAAAAGGGNALRQGISAMLPGSDEMDLGDRALQTGIATTVGGVSQGLVNKGAALYDKVRPHNLIANRTATPYGQEGQKLAQQTGVDLSPGQVTGHRGVVQTEGFLRQHPASADMVYEFGQRQLKQATTRLNNAMDDIAGQGISDISTGQKVVGAFKQAVNSAKKLRSDAGKVEFNEAFKLSGGRPIIETSNMRGAIDELISANDFPGAGNQAAALVKSLTKLRGELGDKVTARHMQKMLSNYGAKAGGTGTLFKDLDKAEQIGVAKKLYGALMDDLDVAADGDVGSKALQVARDNWKANSQAIDDLRQTTLGKMFGGGDPKDYEVAASLVKMHPSEVSAAMKILRSADPEAAQSVKGYLIHAALEASTPNANTAASGVPFSAAKFNTFFQKKQKLFQAAFDPVEYRQVNQVFRSLQRIADTAGMQGSQTAILQQVSGLIKGFATLNPLTLGRSAVGIIAPRHIAKMMTTHRGRQALLTVLNTKKTTKAAIQAANYLTYVATKEGMDDAAVSP